MKGNPGKGKEINKITVLSVGLGREDSSGLAAIFRRSEWPSCPNSEWKLQTSASLPSAVSTLVKEGPQIVVCEKALGKDSWWDLLDQVSKLSDPPSLIVSSRMADEYLWAEALNLGAYDVLAAPFEPAEVVRVLSSAWLHRKHQNELTASKAMRATMLSRAAFVAAG